MLDIYEVHMFHTFWKQNIFYSYKLNRCKAMTILCQAGKHKHRMPLSFQRHTLSFSPIMALSSARLVATTSALPTIALSSHYLYPPFHLICSPWQFWSSSVPFTVLSGYAFFFTLSALVLSWSCSTCSFSLTSVQIFVSFLRFLLWCF